MKRMLALIGLSIAISIAVSVLVTTVVKVAPRLTARDQEAAEAIEP